MDGWSLLSNLVASVIGGLLFYLLSGRDLKRAAIAMKQEAEDLRRLNILIIRAMQEAGLAKFSMDETGKPIGLSFDVVIGGGGVCGGSALEKLIKRN